MSIIYYHCPKSKPLFFSFFSICSNFFLLNHGIERERANCYYFCIQMPKILFLHSNAKNTIFDNKINYLLSLPVLFFILFIKTKVKVCSNSNSNCCCCCCFTLILFTKNNKNCMKRINLISSFKIPSIVCSF